MMACISINAFALVIAFRRLHSLAKLAILHVLPSLVLADRLKPLHVSLYRAVCLSKRGS
jgi:hypothetical protein